MFNKIQATAFPPKDKAIMVWDGDCSFCKYWITVWRRKTGKGLRYAPYQAVAGRFSDIPEEQFARAVRLIEPDGHVFDGPDAAYRSLLYLKKPVLAFHGLYHRSPVFQKLSDYGYDLISRHRPLMFFVTKLLWGRDATHRKPYWAIYLTGTSLLVAAVWRHFK